MKGKAKSKMVSSELWQKQIISDTVCPARGFQSKMEKSSILLENKSLGTRKICHTHQNSNME